MCNLNLHLKSHHFLFDIKIENQTNYPHLSAQAIFWLTTHKQKNRNKIKVSPKTKYNEITIYIIILLWNLIISLGCLLQWISSHFYSILLDFILYIFFMLFSRIFKEIAIFNDFLLSYFFVLITYTFFFPIRTILVKTNSYLTFTLTFRLGVATFASNHQPSFAGVIYEEV